MQASFVTYKDRYQNFPALWEENIGQENFDMQPTEKARRGLV